MWRPKDWGKVSPDPHMWGRDRTLFEAGADAMLEALKKDGMFTCHAPIINLDDTPIEGGYWVFIPKEGK